MLLIGTTKTFLVNIILEVVVWKFKQIVTINMLFFIQILPRILPHIYISHVSFLDLFGPITGVNKSNYVITFPMKYLTFSKLAIASF